MKRTTLARLLGSFMVVCAATGAMSVEVVIHFQMDGPVTVFSPTARWVFQGLFAAFATGGFVVTGMGHRPSWIERHVQRSKERSRTQHP